MARVAEAKLLQTMAARSEERDGGEAVGKALICAKEFAE
jgi:hypothetical protein